MTLPARLRVDVVAAGAAFCAAPLSIAVAELLLGLALASRLFHLGKGEKQGGQPRVFWWWLAWVALEVVALLFSPQPMAGVGELRHLLLIGGLFFILPALCKTNDRMMVWRGIFAASSVGSLALVCIFVARAIRYRPEIAAGGAPAFYLRTGGLLHHWMVYAVVEVLLFGALLEFRSEYPEERWWTTPVLAVNCLAICLSLTRSLWLACFLLFGLHVLLRRPKRASLLPLIPALIFVVAPGPIKARIRDSLQGDYYSNAERVQMWGVGWRMIRERPLIGVGAGRVEELYTAYLPKGALVPAYHGHLHNDALQLAAQFGLPVLCAALLCLAVLLRSLWREYRDARGRDERFLYRVALMGVLGYLIIGLTDYTYGHSLGLILFGFVALSPPIANVRRPIARR